MFFEQSLIEQYKALLSVNDYLYTYSTLQYNNMTYSIGSAMKECCGSNIGTQYIERSKKALVNSFNNNDGIYDLLVSFNVDISQLRSKNLKNNITGFIIVEKGECKKYPNVYSINLICSQPHHKKGSLLFGAFIYSVINNPVVVDKRGVLELANSYFNPGGLCLYTKLGFIIDENMYGLNCFNDYYNLPMILDVSTYGSTIDEQNDRLIKILMGHRSHEFRRHNLCNEKNRNLQILSGLILNLMLFIFHSQTGYILDGKEAGDYEINYLTLYNMIIGKKRGNELDILTNFASSLDTMSDVEVQNILDVIVISPNISPPVAPVAPPSTRVTRTSRLNSTSKKNSKGKSGKSDKSGKTSKSTTTTTTTRSKRKRTTNI